jgi:two-component system chemotaxis sensor kinase CheA
LIRVFLGELEERVSAFDADLATLDGPLTDTERTETVARLFRGAHSLKGAAAAVGASEIEDVCSQLEGVLAVVRAGELDLDASRRFGLSTATAQLRPLSRRFAGDIVPS